MASKWESQVLNLALWLQNLALPSTLSFCSKAHCTVSFPFKCTTALSSPKKGVLKLKKIHFTLQCTLHVSVLYLKDRFLKNVYCNLLYSFILWC
jgi:hypothetical protein